MANDFPAMIYHFTQGQKVINTSDELAKAKSEGWQTVPFEMDEKAIIEKIAWYEREIELLRSKLTSGFETIESEPVKELEEIEPRQKRKYTRRS